MSGDEEIMYELARIAQQKAIQRRRRRPAGNNTRPWPQRIVAQSPAQRTGQAAERLAATHLEAAGLVILDRNLRCKTGEIDLICSDRLILAFVEVRHRTSMLYGGAAASVNRKKQQRLIQTAAYFLPYLTRRYFGGHAPACRFDVVTMERGRINWLKNAFPADIGG